MPALQRWTTIWLRVHDLLRTAAKACCDKARSSCVQRQRAPSTMTTLSPRSARCWLEKSRAGRRMSKSPSTSRWAISCRTWRRHGGSTRQVKDEGISRGETNHLWRISVRSSRRLVVNEIKTELASTACFLDADLAECKADCLRGRRTLLVSTDVV